MYRYLLRMSMRKRLAVARTQPALWRRSPTLSCILFRVPFFFFGAYRFPVDVTGLRAATENT